MRRDDLIAYYRPHYVPGRVILSIVGDVDAPQAIEAARLYLGGMKAEEGAQLGSPGEAGEQAFRYRRLRGDIARTQLVVGFHAAPALSDDVYRYVWDGRVQLHGIHPFRHAPDDPALFVPKRWGIGQTLNFARPSAWLFLAAVTLLPLLLAAVTALVAR